MPRIIADSIDQWLSIEMRYAAQVLYVGGTSARTQRALVAMLREIIENGLKTVYRGF